LMMNPAGAFLAPPQATAEAEWKAALGRDFGITFDRLLVLNNMPISRFLEWLVDSGNLEGCMTRLIDGFTPTALAGVRCRDRISVSGEGRPSDCDFNQLLDLDTPMTVETFDFARWQQRSIITRNHCYGCTAGAGSSCGGATSA